ncbi:Transcription factor AP-4 [Cyphomyrmex costatus]|uniref:Transcription factor AP-4 n=1 Tax=Cyphomyrmex costatus TaxID=456900 RepID=A0A195CBB7_9HYME|nr:Transcription factor AP-4 [Cyphomyrmex costatus]
MGRANPDHGQRSTTISTRVHCFLRRMGIEGVETLNPHTSTNWEPTRVLQLCERGLDPLHKVIRWNFYYVARQIFSDLLPALGSSHVSPSYGWQDFRVKRKVALSTSSTYFAATDLTERALCGYPANERADVTTANHPASKPPASVETVDDGSVTTSVTVAEVADTQERQPQQRQQPPQSKGNVGTGRRVATQTAALSNGNGISNVGRVASRSHMEQEKRMRREIANSNERRRMQSINAGFQSLRTLLPHHEGEKLSKLVRLTLLGMNTTDPRKSLPANLFPTALCHLCEVSETGILEALRRCLESRRVDMEMSHANNIPPARSKIASTKNCATSRSDNAVTQGSRVNRVFSEECGPRET